MTKIYLPPDALRMMMNQLLRDILVAKRAYTTVVGIANGGLTISRYLAYFLDLPHRIATIRLRDGHQIEVPAGLESPFLLVDDIVDTGETLKVFKSCGYIQGVDFDMASLHWCIENSPNEQPNFYAATKKATEWIVYPWEEDYEKRKETDKRTEH